MSRRQELELLLESANTLITAGETSGNLIQVAKALKKASEEAQHFDERLSFFLSVRAANAALKIPIDQVEHYDAIVEMVAWTKETASLLRKVRSG